MKQFESAYVIDDDDTYQFIVQRTIEQTKLVKQIRVFSNGLEAIRFFEASLINGESLPDIILLDLTMPIMDGWGFLEDYVALRPRVGKKIIVYIVSSSINPVDVERARSISAVTDYVVKPLTIEKFVELLQKA